MSGESGRRTFQVVNAHEGGLASDAATVGELFRSRLGDTHVGLREGERSWTWHEVATAALARAGWFAADRPADGAQRHVGLLLENGAEYVFALGGLALSGDVAVALNVTRSAAELADDVRQARVDLVLTTGAFADKLARLPADVTVVDVDTFVWPEPATRPIARSARPEDLYVLLFTSGSTSRPKAVRHSHSRVLARGRQLLAEVELDRDAVIYLPMPIFHAGPLFGLLLPAILAGATLTMRPRFSSSEFVADVRRFGATHTNFVGKTLQYVLARTPEPWPDSPLRIAVGNGAADRDIERFALTFGCRVIDVYGSTEGAISVRRDAHTPAGSIGVAAAGDVRVLDPESGVECPRARRGPDGTFENLDEATGEIVRVDGRGNFEGYFENAEAEAQRVREGRYWSGDLAWRDADGYFYFAGRSGDMVRVDGENVSPFRIQGHVETDPDVEECAAYGIREPGSDDHLMVALVLRPGARPDPNPIFARLSEGGGQLSRREVPRFVRITAAIPRTATNKLLVAPLQREGWRTEDPVWWRPEDRIHFVPFEGSDRPGA